MGVGIWQEVFITRLNNKRTVSETELAEVFRRYSNISMHTFDCAGKALKHALAIKQKDDILFFAGSPIKYSEPEIGRASCRERV